MKFFHKLESFFQTYIEGFFDKKFSSGLQPVEIGKQLVRQMENERFVGVSHIYVPNRYSVYVSQPDYDRLYPYRSAVGGDLAAYLAKKAAELGYTIQGLPVVEICLDQALAAGKFRISCNFEETPDTDQEKTADAFVERELSDTRVFNKAPVQPVLRMHLTGMLTVLEGIDAGLVADIGVNRVNLGRREGNELPLTDMNTSRLHAYIVFEEGGHFIYDAKSLNGTYVNGHRVTRKRLLDGDRIKLGNTTVLYEVK